MRKIQQLSYRLATSEDAEWLATMNKELIQDERSDNSMALGELVTRMYQFLTDEWNAAILLLDDEPIGYALYLLRNNLYNDKNKEIYIRQYFIKREHRQLGIGKRGIELLEEELFSEHSTLVIDVLSVNESGYRFWEAIGFEPYYINMKKRV